MNVGLLERLQQHIVSRKLLSHPFYQDWREGVLTIGDLRHYAGQYYHFEASFPKFLSAIHSRCPDPMVRQGILSNLWDEEQGEENHRALWLRFCSGLGMYSKEVELAPVHPKTGELVDKYAAICSTRPFQEGLAVVYAYEVQVPEVAAEKAKGLQDRYGFTEGDTLAFFRVHAELDKEHSRLEGEAIATHTGAQQEAGVESALLAGLDAWWGFLDGVNEARSS